MNASELQLRLAQREAQGLLRERHMVSETLNAHIVLNGKTYINFSSNDYLGLSQHKEVKQAFIDGIARYGAGSAASPLVTGYQRAHYELEESLCEWTGHARALLFNCGFSANQAVLKALLTKHDSLIQDKLNHASLMEMGALLPCQHLRFKHNDVAHAALQLSRAKGAQRLLVTEGIFSMDGDGAPLFDLAKLCKASKAWFMVDDAHGVGVCGAQGQGSANAAKLSANEVDITLQTFGKALGVSGAALLLNETLHAYLVNFSRSYIYSTAMPAAQACAVNKAVQLQRQCSALRERLQANIELFRLSARQHGLCLSASHSAIQPIIVGEASSALKLSEQLKAQGFFVSAMRPPTVAQGSARLRITLSALHQRKDIIALVGALAQALERNVIYE